MSICGDAVTEAAYWTLTPRSPGADQTEAEWFQGTAQHLKKAVDRRLISDVPVGAYLSGGLDSAIVAALMAKASANRVKTFSIGYSEAPGYDESRYARQVAAHCGTDHHHLDVSQMSMSICGSASWSIGVCRYPSRTKLLFTNSPHL